MDRLWGEFRPVPQEALVVLRGGERIRPAAASSTSPTRRATRRITSATSTPTRGIAFVGDTAGIRRQPDGFVLPPTPPPDIDLELWRDSLRASRRGGADTLFLTHFGPHAPVGAHLTEMARHLELTASLVKASLAQDGTTRSAKRGSPTSCGGSCAAG